MTMRKLIMVLCLFLLVCCRADEVIAEMLRMGGGVAAAHTGLAIDATSSYYLDDQDTTATLAHTCSGSDRVLYVAAINPGAVGRVTGVTYNGVSMTNDFDASAASTYESTGWVLVAPATGTHNIVVTYGTGTERRGVSGISFTGANQTTPTGTAVTKADYDVVASINVGAATGDIVVDALYYGSDTEPTIGAGQTQIYTANGTDTKWQKASRKAGAATTTMSWTFPGQWYVIGGLR